MKKIKSIYNNLIKKKWIKIGAVVLCVSLLFGAFSFSNAEAKNTAYAADYTELYKTNLTDSISVKGVVESKLSRRVYSNLSYTVENVYVEVGDYVKEGEPLAVLDTVDLELKIAQNKEDLSASEKNNLNQLKNSQRLLNEASANLNSGTNTQIVNAESSLNIAETNLQNAQKAYDDTVNDLNSGVNTKVAAAESAVDTAKMELDRLQSNYDHNMSLYDAGAVSQEELKQSERNLNNAKIQYDDALINLENAKTNDARSLEQAEESLKTAKIQYENAVKALDAVNTSAQQEISNYRNTVESAQIAVDNNANILAVEEIEKQLSDSIITAPIDGTVTAVYIKEGDSGQGLLFVVEDTKELKIQTYIKEYDVGNVKEGMAVIIKSDATKEAEYKGVISKIGPAAVKSGSGETVNSSDVEFMAEITVISEETELRIGMNTRMNIILDAREEVYRVPFDAVKTDGTGQRTVFLLEESGKVKEINIETGLETDFYIEISGNDLYDGAKIINDISGLEDGMKFS